MELAYTLQLLPYATLVAYLTYQLTRFPLKEHLCPHKLIIVTGALAGLVASTRDMSALQMIANVLTPIGLLSLLIALRKKNNLCNGLRP